MTKYKLEIKPAILPVARHKLHAALKAMGFYVSGGGTRTDMTTCDISFEDPTDDEAAKGGRK